MRKTSVQIFFHTLCVCVASSSGSPPPLFLMRMRKATEWGEEEGDEPSVRVRVGVRRARVEVHGF